jgi:hypothetical protein
VESGAEVIAFEPYKLDVHLPGVKISTSLEDALGQRPLDLITVLVAHRPFKDLLPEQVAGLTQTRMILDLVNIWEPAKWKSLGFQVHRLGVGSND